MPCIEFLDVEEELGDGWGGAGVVWQSQLQLTLC